MLCVYRITDASQSGIFRRSSSGKLHQALSIVLMRKATAIRQVFVYPENWSSGGLNMTRPDDFPDTSDGGNSGGCPPTASSHDLGRPGGDAWVTWLQPPLTGPCTAHDVATTPPVASSEVTFPARRCCLRTSSAKCFVKKSHLISACETPKQAPGRKSL